MNILQQQSFITSKLNFLDADFSHFLHQHLLSESGILAFQEHIKLFYQSHGRMFAWRSTQDPYHIVVSEIMLQQTQTERVKEKFSQFIIEFPDFKTLSQATNFEVIKAWQGLGYNRRALALHALAQDVVQKYQGNLPDDPQKLTEFKGIGPNTAGSICVFAFNKPVVFIETNIRTVFIHSFFRNQIDIHDKLLIPLIEQTIDKNNPRIWYYALMDYGVALKKAFKNPSRKSKHHTKQSKFEGSERQIRGMILRALTAHKALTFDMLCDLIDRQPSRIERNLQDLVNEGFVTQRELLFFI